MSCFQNIALGYTVFVSDTLINEAHFVLAITHHDSLIVLIFIIASAEPFNKSSTYKEHIGISQSGVGRVSSQSAFSNPRLSRASQDASSLGVSRRLTSSTSSLDSECGSRGAPNLINYTMLADIPQAKRLRPALSHLDPKSRWRSPGKAEVERLFGQERK